MSPDDLNNDVTAAIDIRLFQDRGHITIRLGEVRILGGRKDTFVGYFVQVIFGSTSLFFLSTEVKHRRIISFNQIFTGPNPSGLDVPLVISLFDNAFAVSNNNETATLIGRLEVNLDDLIDIAGSRPMDEEFWLPLFHQISTVAPTLRPVVLEFILEGVIEMISRRPESTTVDSIDDFGEFDFRPAVANENQSLSNIANDRPSIQTPEYDLPRSNRCSRLLTNLVMSRSYRSDTCLCTLNAPVELEEIFPRPNGSSQPLLVSNSINLEADTKSSKARPLDCPSNTPMVLVNRTSPLDEHIEFGKGSPVSHRSNQLPPVSNNSTIPRPDGVFESIEARPLEAYPYPSHTRGPIVGRTRVSEGPGLPLYQSCGKCFVNGRWLNRYRLAFKREENMTEVGFELSVDSPATIVSVKAHSRADACGLKVGDVILKIEDLDVLGMDSQTILEGLRNARKSLCLEFGRPVNKTTVFGVMQNIRDAFSCRARTHRGNSWSPRIDNPPCPLPTTSRVEEERPPRRIFGSLGLKRRLNVFRKKKSDKNYCVSKATKKFTADNSVGIESSETVSKPLRSESRSVTNAGCKWQTSHVHNSGTRRVPGTVRLMPLPKPPIVITHRNVVGLNATYDNIDDLPDAELDSDDYDDTIVSDEIDNEPPRKSAANECRNAKPSDDRTTTVGTARVASVPDDVGVLAGDQAAADTSGYVTSSRDSEVYAASEGQSLTNFPLSSSRRTRKRRRFSRVVDDDDKENAAAGEAALMFGSSDRLDEANVARFFGDASFDSNVEIAEESDRNLHAKIRKELNQTFVVPRTKKPSSSGGNNIPSNSLTNGCTASQSPSQISKSTALIGIYTNAELSDDLQHDSPSLVVPRKRHTTCIDHKPRSSQGNNSDQRTNGNQKTNSKYKGKSSHKSKISPKPNESPTASDKTPSLGNLVRRLTSALHDLEFDFRGQFVSMTTHLREFVCQQDLKDHFRDFLDVMDEIETTNLEHCSLVCDWGKNPPGPEHLVQFSIRQLKAYRSVFKAYIEKLGTNMRRFKVLIAARNANLSKERLEEMLILPVQHFKKVLHAVSDFAEPVEHPGIGCLSKVLIECWKLLEVTIEEMPKVRVSRSRFRNCQKRTLGEL